MFDQSSLDFLKALLTSSSPSGFEAEAAKVFRDRVADCCRVRCDVMGNTIASLNEDAPMRVMLAGHYDEIGFQVVYISPEGLIYFRKDGGIDKLNVPASEVEILTRNGRVPGVIGKKPIHLLSAKEREVPPELEDMWIDIGASSYEEASALVSVGDPIAIRSNFRMLNGNRFYSKGTDDKIGAFIVAETMRALAQRKLNVAVFGVGTVQEEVGCRGAIPGSFGIDPAVGFVLDVGFASDLPDIPRKKLGDVRLGGGPEITRNCDNNLVLVETLRRTAEQHRIPVQETAGRLPTGGTDAAKIQLTRSGVATALLSIPNRYMHSQVEICDLRDAENAVRLLTETIAGFRGDEDFCPVR